MGLLTFGAFSSIVAAFAVNEHRLLQKGQFERSKPSRIFVGTFVAGTLVYLIYDLSTSVVHVFGL